jgi:rhodanese-related sulfurtransferase
MKVLPSVVVLLALAVLPLRSAEDPKAKPAHGDKPATPKPVRNVGVEEFDKLRADSKNTVLDVRTADEFAKGHIPGAVNLDYNAPDFQKKVAALDKNKTYLVHCAGGVRSAKACVVMDNLQFKSLINLEPGFRAWEKAGKPVEKKP